jgi:sugar lactone lactonase YvrE
VRRKGFKIEPVRSTRRIDGRLAGGLGFALLVSAGLLLLVHVPIEPVAWQAPVVSDYSSVFAANDRLSRLSAISIGNATGPETIAIGPDGELFTGVHSGEVLRINPQTFEVDVWAHQRGRVFGVMLDGKGNVVAANGLRGLIALDQNRRLSVLRSSPPLGFVNSVAVAKNGKIYFTEATQRFLPQQWGDYVGLLDVLEHSATGRVHEYDPVTKRDRVLMEHLCFANGVALSLDERSLFVAETCEYRVWKLGIDAEHVDAKAGETMAAKILLKDLPGLPDNITRGSAGRIWVGLVKQRSGMLDAMSSHPWLRKLLLLIPWNFLLQYSAQTHVFAMDENGTVLIDLQDAAGAAREVTGATETTDRLYLQSLEGDEIKWLDTRLLEQRAH